MVFEVVEAEALSASVSGSKASAKLKLELVMIAANGGGCDFVDPLSRLPFAPSRARRTCSGSQYRFAQCVGIQLREKNMCVRAEFVGLADEAGPSAAIIGRKGQKRIHR
jgi:hypothetical protein